MASSPSRSVSSKAESAVESMSSTPATLPSERCRGTTISERESDEHAMWPANCYTSSTTRVVSRCHAVPHTPRP